MLLTLISLPKNSPSTLIRRHNFSKGTRWISKREQTFICQFKDSLSSLNVYIFGLDYNIFSTLPANKKKFFFLLQNSLINKDYDFPRLAPIACFPALGTNCMFSRAWHQLHVFPRLAPIACLRVLALFACFPALGIDCMFSRVWHGLHVYPHLLHLFY